MAHPYTTSGDLISTPRAGDTRGRGGGGSGGGVPARIDMPERRTVPSRTLPSGGGRGGRGKPDAAPKAGNPLKLAHALLRGKYKWAIPTAGLLAAAGGLVGFSVMEPEYTSRGIVEITPYMNGSEVIPGENVSVMPMFGAYLNTQANLVSSRRIAELALGGALPNPASDLGADPTVNRWENLPDGSKPSVDKFMESLDIDVPRDSYLFNIYYTSPDPAVAQAATHMALLAYQSVQAESIDVSVRERLNKIEGEMRVIRANLTRLDNEAELIRERDGNTYAISLKVRELQNEAERKRVEVNRLEEALGRLDSQDEQEADNPATATASGEGEGESEWVDGAPGDEQEADNPAPATARGEGEGESERVDGAPGAEDAGPVVPPAQMPEGYRQLAQSSESFNSLYQTRLQLQRNRESLSVQYGPEHRGVRQVNRQLAIIDRELAAEAAYLATVNSGGVLDPTVDGYSEDAARNHVEKLKIAIRALQTESAELSSAIDRLVQIGLDRERNNERLRTLTDRRDSLTAERDGIGRVDVRSYGDVPGTPSNDKRIKAAGGGAAAGAFLGLGLFALWGLFDRRLRWLDDPRNAELLAGDRVLAALPDMKGGAGLMAGDDEAVAFQLHKLRLTLQRAARAGRRSFAITSAVSGDGKTSVTLALGLSLSASGTRTLLIDFDLVGKSLSRRFGRKMNDGDVDSVERGLGAVLRGTPVEECFRPTEVNRLDLLSCADAGSEDARRLSPRFARHVLREALENYEVVLIDTGPLLASLEANLIAGEADGTVLCVSRGTSRDLVKKGVEILEDKGSVFEGIVVNRLDAGQFDKHIASTMSMSVPQDPTTAWRSGAHGSPRLVTRAAPPAANGHNGTNGHA